MKKIRKNYKAPEFKDDENKLSGIKLSSNIGQLSNSAEKNAMIKKTKYSLSQAETTADSMDNIEQIKSPADIKKQTSIQNLM
jgi:hypothetical protein